MTILQAAQSAFLRLVGQEPDSLFSSTETMQREIRNLANDIATDIMKTNDWRGLARRNDMVGDGTATGFPLPADYDRMVTGGGVSRPGWGVRHYLPVSSISEWQNLINLAVTVTPGYWIILDGKMEFYPPLPQGQPAQFWYISRHAVKGADGQTKERFTQDTDEFVFGDRLMTLALVWRWRAQKRMDYAEDLALFEKALNETMSNDKGSRIIAEGPARMQAGTGMSSPFGMWGGYA